MSEFKTGRAWKDSLLKKASLKSQAEFYLDLCTQLVRSDPLGTTSHSSLERDIETLRSRFLSEGLSFLTKTLPKLGKALDMGLVSSRFNRPREFKSSHSSASKPAFLQAYFNLVFGDDGLLRDEVPPLAVKHLRQVLFFAYKLELPYDSKLEAAVVSTFRRRTVHSNLQNAMTQVNYLIFVLALLRVYFRILIRRTSFRDMVPGQWPLVNDWRKSGRFVDFTPKFTKCTPTTTSSSLVGVLNCWIGRHGTCLWSAFKKALQRLYLCLKIHVVRGSSLLNHLNISGFNRVWAGVWYGTSKAFVRLRRVISTSRLKTSIGLLLLLVRLVKILRPLTSKTLRTESLSNLFVECLETLQNFFEH
jgi:hypothetical protein